MYSKTYKPITAQQTNYSRDYYYKVIERDPRFSTSTSGFYHPAFDSEQYKKTLPVGHWQMEGTLNGTQGMNKTTANGFGLRANPNKTGQQFEMEGNLEGTQGMNNPNAMGDANGRNGQQFGMEGNLDGTQAGNGVNGNRNLMTNTGRYLTTYGRSFMDPNQIRPGYITSTRIHQNMPARLRRPGEYESIPHVTQTTSIFRPGTHSCLERPVLDETGTTLLGYEQIRPPYNPYLGNPDKIPYTYTKTLKDTQNSVGKFRNVANETMNPLVIAQEQKKNANLNPLQLEQLRKKTDDDRKAGLGRLPLDFASEQLCADQGAAPGMTGINNANQNTDNLYRRKVMTKPTVVNYSVMMRSHPEQEARAQQQFQNEVPQNPTECLPPQIPQEQCCQPQPVSEAPKYNYPAGYEDRNQQIQRNEYVEPEPEVIRQNYQRTQMMENAPTQQNPWLEEAQPQGTETMPPMAQTQQEQAPTRSNNNPWLEQVPQEGTQTIPPMTQTQEYEQPPIQQQQAPTKSNNNPWLEEVQPQGTQSMPQNQAPVQQNRPVMPQGGGGKIIESNESSGVYDALNQNYIHNVNNVQNTFGKGQMSNNMEDYNNSQYGIPLQDRPALKQGAESNESYGVSEAINSNFVPYDGSVGPKQILDISEYGPRNGPSSYKIGAGNQSSGVCGIFHGK